jgi:hypothetical protein
MHQLHAKANGPHFEETKFPNNYVQLILNKKHREKNVWLFHAEQCQSPHCIFLNE